MQERHTQATLGRLCRLFPLRKEISFDGAWKLSWEAWVCLPFLLPTYLRGGENLINQSQSQLSRMEPSQNMAGRQSLSLSLSFLFLFSIHCTSKNKNYWHLGWRSLNLTLILWSTCHIILCRPWVILNGVLTNDTFPSYWPNTFTTSILDLGTYRTIMLDLGRYVSY